jgi:MFS family permease
MRPRVLRDRAVLALLVAETVSTTGTQMTNLALPWFALATTGSAARMGVVVATQLAAIALFSVPAGAVAVRLGARRTLLATNLVAGSMMLAIPLLHRAGSLSFGLLLVLVFVSGIFWAPYFAAQRAILPDLLGEDAASVADANALLQITQRAAVLLGPVIAGALIVAIGAPAVLVVDAGTFLFALATIALFVPQRRVVVAERAHGMLAGLRAVLRDRFLRGTTVAIAVGDATSEAMFAALPFYAFTRYDGDAKVAGGLIACFGASAAVGSVASFRIRPRVDAFVLVAVGALAQALPLWLLTAAGPAWIVAVALVLPGFATGVVNPTLHTLMTLRLPAPLRTQGLSAILAANVLLGPVGYLTAGFVLNDQGVSPLFAGVALVQTLAMALCAVTALREQPAIAYRFADGVRRAVGGADP